ncbi:MAG: Flp family type IVb pilin [Dongiaceae bacterium]
MSTIVRRFLLDDRGATAVEYGLIAAIISVGVAGFAQPLSDMVMLMYTLVLDAVIEASPSP